MSISILLRQFRKIDFITSQIVRCSYKEEFWEIEIVCFFFRFMAQYKFSAAQVLLS